MYVSVKKLFKCEIKFPHSLDKGMYVQVLSKNKLSDEDVKNLKDNMDALIKEDAKITKKVVSRKDAFNFYQKIGENEKAMNILNLNNKIVTLYELKGFYNYFMGDMLESTGSLTRYNLTYLGNNDFVISYPYDDSGYIPKYHEQNLILRSFTQYNYWCKLLKTNYAADINHIVAESKIKEFIKKNDIIMDYQFFEIADVINKEKRKVILLGGPSSSGKTTSTRKLALNLSSLGLNPVYLSLDDYFKERVDSPKDADGEYNYESLDCIDLELFNKQLTELLEGKKIIVPTFNFITGKKEFNRELKLNENDIILIEGLHCLNEELSKTIPQDKKLKIYISPFTPISIDRHNHLSTIDIRLLRRIVRDNRTRGYSVTDTLKSWEKVRTGETSFVFPFTNEANIILNTAYAYEMGVLRVYVEPLLYSVPIDSKYFNEARRLISLLQIFFPIPSEYLGDSNIIREFIGGSYFE